MEHISDSLGPMFEMVRGTRPYDGEEMHRLAGEVAASGGAAMTALFPEGSMDPPTEALPAIWEDWDRLEQLAQDLVDAANRVAEIAGEGLTDDVDITPPDDPRARGGRLGARRRDPSPLNAPAAMTGVRQAVFALPRVCQGCHQDFRVKQD